VKRVLSSLALALLLVSAANAASIQVDWSGTPSPGSEITLDVRVTANGEVDGAVLGVMRFPTSSVTVGTRVQYSLPPGLPPTTWDLFSSCDFSSCTIFRQRSPYSTAIRATDFHLASATFVLDADLLLGTVLTFEWETVDFFGVTSAPAYQVTVVPEPASAALLGLGLLALAFRDCRRA
jgi:hypothetical protein